MPCVGDEDADSVKTPGKYSRFWDGFSKPMKLGLIEDSSNRQRLAKLLRFTSSKSKNQLTSLEEYVERMKSTQKKIYYIIGKASRAFRANILAAKPFVGRAYSFAHRAFWAVNEKVHNDNNT